MSVKTVAIVQARMGSTRFPGKTLADLAGTTLLERVVQRIARARCVDQVVVATTLQQEDDAVAERATAAGCAVFRGSTNDVLDRYVRAAREHDAGIVIRNTADEPFLDPALIDECFDAFRAADVGDPPGPPADYAANNLRHIYPEGIDTEVVSIRALETAWQEATLPSDREHVTPFIWRQPERFRLIAAGGQPLRPELRLTVDYPADLEFARILYEVLGPDSMFGLRDVTALLDERPDLLALCPAVPRREGYRKSVSEE